VKTTTCLKEYFSHWPHWVRKQLKAVWLKKKVHGIQKNKTWLKSLLQRQTLSKKLKTGKVIETVPKIHSSKFLWTKEKYSSKLLTLKDIYWVKLSLDSALSTTLKRITSIQLMFKFMVDRIKTIWQKYATWKRLRINILKASAQEFTESTLIHYLLENVHPQFRLLNLDLESHCWLQLVTCLRVLKKQRKTHFSLYHLFR